MTGGAATNALANIYGIGPQNYEAAFSNGGMSSGGTNAQGLATNWGAGQPVAGHTGGGGPNALAAAAGSAAGSFFGPVGTAVGGALGGLIRGDGDNWQTKQTIAPEGYDYDKFWNDNPDLQVSKNGWPKADVQALFGGNRNAYLDWFQKQSPDRKIPLLAGYEVGANGVPVLSTAAPAAGGGATSGANALASPMKAFEATPYYDMAVKGFRGVDTPDVNAAYAKGGKVLSGAQSIALDERGKNRLGGAFGQYTAGLSDLADLNSTASNQAGTAATNYGTSTGRAIVDGGTAKGNDVPGYLLGGKTGTANRVDDSCGCYKGYTSSFIGVVPADDPQLVAAVIVQDPQGAYMGSDNGVPVFKELMTAALQARGVAPTGNTDPLLPVYADTAKTDAATAVQPQQQQPTATAAQPQQQQPTATAAQPQQPQATEAKQ